MSSSNPSVPDVSVKAIIDRFSHYSSTTIAKFVLPAAETEIQQEANGSLDEISPSRSNLFDNFRLINQLTIANPQEGRDLKLVAAEDYVNKSLANRRVTTMGTATNDTRQDRLSQLLTTSRQLTYNNSNTEMTQTTTPTTTKIVTATMNAIIPDGPAKKKRKNSTNQGTPRILSGNKCLLTN